MKPRTYKDKLTLDGRLKLVPGVNAAKVAKAKELTEKHLAGDRVASAVLEEVMTTSDAMFNVAHLATLNFVADYDEAPRQWQKIATVRPTSDFRDVTLYSIQRSWTDGDGESNVLGAHGEAPVVPEGTPYPYAYIKGEVNQGGKLEKRGFKTDFTLESRINDSMGIIDALPQMMKDTSLDTEEAWVFSAIANLTSASDLAGGTVPTGATVLPNAAFSRDAAIRAAIELSERKINGRNIQVNGSFNLLCPIGQGIFYNFVLNQTLAAFESNGTPNYLYQINGGYNPLAGVDVVETEWLTGAAWALIPKPRTTRRPVIEKLELKGYETPQLFVENINGTYFGGSGTAKAWGFEGNFDTDSTTLKLRQFGKGIIWDGGLAIVRSNGTGVA